jgi:hypothetical protein
MREKNFWRKLYITGSAIALLTLTGCSSQEEEIPVVETEPVEKIAVETPQPTEVEALLGEASEDSSSVATSEETVAETEGLDYIDLTEMSGTMVYSQVYNMVYYPERFTGTKVKMQGTFSDYLDLASGKRYYGCIIQDATACCAQGLEFNPTDDFTYPDDFPADGDIVTVEGEFDTYIEDGAKYCTLRNAQILDIVHE